MRGEPVGEHHQPLRKAFGGERLRRFTQVLLRLLWRNVEKHRVTGQALEQRFELRTTQVTVGERDPHHHFGVEAL